MGMKQRVFGSYRTLGDELLAQAGPAAEGFEAVFPYDPSRRDPRWLAFQQRYEARYGAEPEQFAALAFDAMNMLLDSICKAGLNRARIQDALDQVYQYDGVTSHMVFDPNNKDVSPMYLGTVQDGAITYRVAKMDKTPQQPQAAIPAPAEPYARVGEDPVNYRGPHLPDFPPGPVKIILFGPRASDVADSAGVRAVLNQGDQQAHWQILPVDSNQNWGAASSQLVRGLTDQHALVIVALDRDSAHLAEQLALKAFVPVIALCGDKTLTSTNIPWIFRLPAATDPVSALTILRAAEAQSGPNPERLRDALASGRSWDGVAFLSTGEPRAQ